MFRLLEGGGFFFWGGGCLGLVFFFVFFFFFAVKDVNAGIRSNEDYVHQMLYLSFHFKPLLQSSMCVNDLFIQKTTEICPISKQK